MDSRCCCLACGHITETEFRWSKRIFSASPGNLETLDLVTSRVSNDGLKLPWKTIARLTSEEAKR